MKNNLLEDKNIIITGGNKGIGLEIATKLIENGANVISLNRSNSKNKISENKHYHQIKCNINNFERLKNVIEQIKTNYQNIDILINNAGIIDFKPFVESDLNTIHNILNTNFISAINLTYLILPNMIKHKNGLILNISSVAALYNYANCAIYNASKSGLLSFSRSLRNETRKTGIKIIDILAGPTNTDIWDFEMREKFHSQMINPSAIAEISVESIINSFKNNLIIEEIIITPQNGGLEI